MERIAARAVEVDFAADHVIARQGEIGTGFFVIASGGARVIRDGVVIAQSGPRRLLRRAVGPRRPAARSRRSSPTEPTTVWAWPRGTSRRCIREEPAVALAVMRGLAAPPARRDRRARTTEPAMAADRSPVTAPRAAAGGTATFLFTDIEGSTSLEERVGTARYAELRERHRALLRAAFGAHGGDEQGTEGDSFFVVFASAREAVAAAVDAQRALATEPWPDDAPVRVRMGLHSGEAGIGRAAASSGLDVNRAARIAAAGHGGQIWPRTRPAPSSATRCRPASACASSASTGCATCWPRSGSSRWRATGCQPSSRRCGRRDPRPNNLPTQLTTFVGRDDELAEAARPLRDDPAADDDRARRDRQDATLAPAGRRPSRTISPTGSSSCRWSRSATRCSSRRGSRRPSGIAEAGGRPIADGPRRLAREPARPARPRQLRAGRRRRRRSSPACSAPRRD